MAWKKIGENYREAPDTYSCAAADTKPTEGVLEGSVLYELQGDSTLKKYRFIQGDWRADV